MLDTYQVVIITLAVRFQKSTSIKNSNKLVLFLLIFSSSTPSSPSSSPTHLHYFTSLKIYLTPFHSESQIPFMSQIFFKYQITSSQASSLSLKSQSDLSFSDRNLSRSIKHLILIQSFPPSYYLRLDIRIHSFLQLNLFQPLPQTRNLNPSNS